MSAERKPHDGSYREQSTEEENERGHPQGKPGEQRFDDRHGDDAQHEQAGERQVGPTPPAVRSNRKLLEPVRESGPESAFTVKYIRGKAPTRHPLHFQTR